MKSSIFSYVTAITLAFSSSAFATQQRDCGGDYKYLNSAPAGTKHNDVERAGVVLCKDYGQDERAVNDRYVIILGHDRNLDCWLPQAGKIEKAHKFTTVTAAAELCEETGGLLKYDPSKIRKLPYIYAGKKQLFFLCDAKNPNIGVTAIVKSCAAAAKNPNLPACYKEIDDATAVPVVELLELAYKIKTQQIPHSSTYTLHKRSLHGGNVIPIKIDGFYMRMFATRYDEAKAIFSQLFGTQF